MKSVVLLTTYPSDLHPVGGVGTYSEALVAALRALGGLDVAVAAQKQPPPRDHFAQPVWSSGSTLIKELTRNALMTKAELVHMQHEPFLFGKGRAAISPLNLPRHLRRAGISCVMTLHAVPFPTFFDRDSAAPRHVQALGKLYLKLLVRTKSDVDAFIVHEEQQVETLTVLAGFERDRIHVIPHGVDELAPRTNPGSEAPFTVGAYGYLTPYKDPEYLLEEFQSFRATYEDARLLFSVAPHPHRKARSSISHYSELMQKARSIPAVETFGYIPDNELPGFLNRCHVVVMPYRYAVSSSGVMAKSLAAGTPILVPHFIEHPLSREWTFRYERGGLARALARLAPEIARQESSLTEATTRSSWHNVALQHKAIYDFL